MRTYHLDDYITCPEIPVQVRDRLQESSAAPHTHDYTEVVTVRTGGGIHVRHLPSGQQIENAIVKGDVFTILPGEIHGYRDCRDFRIYNLMFRQEFISAARPKLETLQHFHDFFTTGRPFGLQQLHLRPNPFLDAVSVLRRLCLALVTPRPSQALAVELALLEYLRLVFDCDTSGWHCQESELDARLMKSIEEIENAPAKKFSVPAAARKAGMSPSSYAHKFKQLVGVPPSEYSLLMRLDQARRLLEESEYSIDRVAADCGFCDSNHLIREYKERFGITPGKYRVRFRFEQQGILPTISNRL